MRIVKKEVYIGRYPAKSGDILLAFDNISLGVLGGFLLGGFVDTRKPLVILHFLINVSSNLIFQRFVVRLVKMGIWKVVLTCSARNYAFDQKCVSYIFICVAFNHNFTTGCWLMLLIIWREYMLWRYMTKDLMVQMLMTMSAINDDGEWWQIYWL